MRTFMLLLIAALMTCPAAAQTANTRVLAKGAESPKASIDSLAWLAGRWVGTGLGAEAEVVYSPPRDGVMLGHLITTKPDGSMRFYELFEIEAYKGSLRVRVKHFEPDFVAWEEKDKTIDFPLVAIEGNRFYFDGATIERVDEATFHDYVAIEHEGKIREGRFEYHRADKDDS
jgi:hypothetical protein